MKIWKRHKDRQVASVARDCRKSLKDRAFLKIASTISELSTCERSKVGAIVVTEDNSQIVGIGYNGNYAGGPNVCDSLEEGKCGCVHAEQNALLKFSSIMYKNAKMYVTLSPCMMCAKLIINAGIKQVYYDVLYRDVLPVQMLRKNNILVEKI